MAIPTAEQFDNALEIAFVGSSAAAERLARQNRVELIEALVFAVRQDERRKMAEQVTPEAEEFIDQLVGLPWDGNDVRWWPRVRTMVQALITKVRRGALLNAAKAIDDLIAPVPDHDPPDMLACRFAIEDLLAQLDAEAKPEANDGG